MDLFVMLIPDDKNVLSGRVRVPESVPEWSLVERVRKRVADRLVADGPDSLLRARVYDPNPLLYYFSLEPIQAITDQMVCTVDTTPSTPELTRRLVKSRLPVMWVIHTNTCYCVASHRFVDGCRFLGELLSVPLDHSWLDVSKVPVLSYRDLLVGLGALPTLFPTLLSQVSRTRNLSHDPSVSPGVVDMQSYPFEQFKELRRYLRRRYGDSNFPLSLLVSLVSCMQLFRTTDTQTLNVGLLYATSHTNSISFNNTCVVPVQVHIPATGRDTLGIFHGLADQLRTFAQTAHQQMLLTRIATACYHPVMGVTPKSLDCCVSLFPSRSPVTYDGVEVTVDQFYYGGTNVPVYCKWYTSSQSIVCRSFLQSPDVSPGYGSTWNISELLECIRRP
jgi:hypothetical protein